MHVINLRVLRTSKGNLMKGDYDLVLSNGYSGPEDERKRSEYWITRITEAA